MKCARCAHFVCVCMHRAVALRMHLCLYAFRSCTARSHACIEFACASGELSPSLLLCFCVQRIAQTVFRYLRCFAPSHGQCKAQIAALRHHTGNVKLKHRAAGNARQQPLAMRDNSCSSNGAVTSYNCAIHAATAASSLFSSVASLCNVVQRQKQSKETVPETRLKLADTRL
jgi:hypothetical protein